MPFTKEQIEYYHDKGLMPDWIYYQQNGATPQENIDRQRKKMIDDIKEQEQLQKEIEAELEQLIEKTLDDLLKDFNKKAIYQ